MTSTFADRSEFLLQVGGPGYLFGDAVLAAKPASARATAITKVQAVLLSRAELERIFEDIPGSFRRFGVPLLERYHVALKLLAQGMTMGPEQYFRVRLALLISRWRKDGYTDSAIEINISQTEAARMLGLSRQTLNRYLVRMEEEGLIETGFRYIRVLEPERLSRMAEAI